MASAVLGALVAGVLGVATCSNELEERVPAEPGGRLEVDIDFGEGLRPDPGSLEVISHDGTEVRILAEPSGWGASGVRLRVDPDGDTLRIYGSVGGAVSWMFGGPHVPVRVWVPREFSLDLRCSAGPIRVEDVRGNVRARTEDAAIEVTAAEGDLRLRTTEGDIRVSDVTGDVRVRSDDGDIELRWIRGDVDARTGRGPIEASHVTGRLGLRSERGSLELTDIDGPIEATTLRGEVFASFLGDPSGALETRRGGVDVVIPRDASAQLEALSGRGEVEIADGLDVPGAHSESRVTGAMNGGGEVLRLYTARGDVRVQTRWEGAR